MNHSSYLKVVFSNILFLFWLEKTVFSITGNFGYQPPSHGDFLGSILGTGIAREKLGDIILQVSLILCSLFDSEFDLTLCHTRFMES